MTVQAHKTNVNRDGKSLDEWIPPQDAVKFIHSSINFCDEMDTHNYMLDYDGTITGTTGITDHPLSNIANHDFDTYWQNIPQDANGIEANPNFTNRDDDDYTTTVNLTGTYLS